MEFKLYVIFSCEMISGKKEIKDLNTGLMIHASFFSYTGMFQILFILSLFLHQ